MRKEVLDKKVNELERATGIKESGVKLFMKVSPDQAKSKYYAYCYSEDNNGDKTFYKNGSPLTDTELQNIEANCKVIIDDI